MARAFDDLIEARVNAAAEEGARAMALVATRLALPPDHPEALSRTSAAVLLRVTAEGMQRRHTFDRALPPWPADGPPESDWPLYAIGKKK